MDKYTIEFSKDSKRNLMEINNYIKNNLQEPNIAKKLITTLFFIELKKKIKFK